MLNRHTNNKLNRGLMLRRRDVTRPWCRKNNNLSTWSNLNLIGWFRQLTYRHTCQGTYASKQTYLLHFNVQCIVNVHVQLGSSYPMQPRLHILLSDFRNAQGNDICSCFSRVFPLAVCLSLMYWYACQFWVHICISQFPPFCSWMSGIHELRSQSDGADHSLDSD